MRTITVLAILSLFLAACRSSETDPIPSPEPRPTATQALSSFASPLPPPGLLPQRSSGQIPLRYQADEPLIGEPLFDIIGRVDLAGEVMATHLSSQEMVCVHPLDSQTEMRSDRCTCWIGPLDKVSVSGGGPYSMRRILIARGSAETAALALLEGWSTDLTTAGVTPCTSDQLVIGYDGGVFKPQPQPPTPISANRLTVPVAIKTLLFIGGMGEINRLDLNSGQVMPLPANHKALFNRLHVPTVLHCPRHSPDGRQMMMPLYAGMSTGLYLANADGSEPKLLAHRWLGRGEGYPPDAVWSPNSQQIAFTDEGALFVISANVQESVQSPWQPQSGDWKIAADAQLKRLAKSGAEQPNWSPNGDWVAFAANTNRNNRDIYLISPQVEDQQES